MPPERRTCRFHGKTCWRSLIAGMGYVGRFINNLNSFDLYLYQPADLGFVNVVPTYVPTRTPIPAPTVFVSRVTIMVQVYLDRNGNGSPDVDEWIDAKTVLMTTSDNSQLTQRTQKGLRSSICKPLRPELMLLSACQGCNVAKPFRCQNMVKV